MTKPFPWRLIISPPADGATHMALDYAMATYVGQGLAPPTLRFYRWQPACLSLGYFQRINESVNLAACRAAGIDLVRRPTGGRAILHAAEVTYALAVPSDYPGFGGRVLETYRTISSALLAGLHSLGVAAQWSAGEQGPHSAACFDTPGDYEITVAGRKLIGSAQTRTRRTILQHGSLLLSVDVPLLHQILRLPADLSASALAQRMISLDEALGRTVSFDEAAAALRSGFAQTLGIAYVQDEPSAAEWTLVEHERQRRYANDAWTFKR